MIRGAPVGVRGRQKPIELLFNLEHPEKLAVVTEVNEEGNDEEDEEELIEDEVDSSEDELQKRFDRMTFVVATRKLEQLPCWVKVSEVFKSDSDRPFLKRAGITDLDDPRAEKYSQRLARLRGVRKYVYRMDILERALSYDEVTEIFVRVNSLGTKLRSSDLALAQITAKWRGALKTFQTFQWQCGKAGFDLDLGLHLKNLVAFATGQSRFLTVGSLPVGTLQRAWKECVPGMEFALNFLKSNAGLDSLRSSRRRSCSSRWATMDTRGTTRSGPERPNSFATGCSSQTPKDGTRGDRARRYLTRISRPCDMEAAQESSSTGCGCRSAASI